MSLGRGYRVRGRVQGVGFRWWTERLARRLGVAGSVRNEADGSVVVIAWGGVEALSKLEAELGKGPAGARVDAVERLADPAPPAPGGFTIAR